MGTNFIHKLQACITNVLIPVLPFHSPQLPFALCLIVPVAGTVDRWKIDFTERQRCPDPLDHRETVAHVREEVEVYAAQSF